jgi:hypothetical protein
MHGIAKASGISTSFLYRLTRHGKGLGPHSRGRLITALQTYEQKDRARSGVREHSDLPESGI